MLAWAAFLTGCNNVFHNLLPPPDREIMEFVVLGKDGSLVSTAAEIGAKAITVTVPKGTDLSSLLPVVTISEKATVIPGTLPYLTKLFPGRDLMQLAIEMNSSLRSGEFQSWFLNLVLETEGFSIPELTIPVDFTGPVTFCVVSGRGDYSMYTVNVVFEGSRTFPEDGPYGEAGDGTLILSFGVPGQRGDSVISHQPATVDFTVEQGTDIRSLLPSITVSSGARVMPLTMDYIMSCGLTYDQLLGFYTGYSTATDVNRYVATFLGRATNLTVPALTRPMDFSSPVPVAVVDDEGRVRVYTATCTVHQVKPILEKVSFSKTKNPYLVGDASCQLSGSTFSVRASYPVDMALDYQLVPDLVYTGDRTTYTMPGGVETELVSGQTIIPFSASVGECTVSVYRGGNRADYTLQVTPYLDPDTARSVTDYRFTTSRNLGIRSTVIASIYNEGDTGFISATILYEGGVAPYSLVADFITPGRLSTGDTLAGSVPGTVQTSGVSSNDFQYARKFLCTSRNGLYSRLYTVSVKFIQVLLGEAAIKLFSFPAYLNRDLSTDAVASINQVDGSIRVEALYTGAVPPTQLVAEFAATGTVVCGGVPQTSGYSGNDYTYSVPLTVYADHQPGAVSKDYKVEVVFRRDSSFACELLSFGFYSQDNRSLRSSVAAIVTQRDGSIYAFLPLGTGGASGTPLVPYFTAEGIVTVSGVVQTSRASAQDFSRPVVYTVTSTNGARTKDYVVTVQERGSVIYVDSRAYGRNNGSSWQDAYLSLDLALQQADQSNLTGVEVWVAGTDVHRPVSSGSFRNVEGMTIRGGFSGTESSHHQRQRDGSGRLVSRLQMQGTGERLFSDNGRSGSLDGVELRHDGDVNMSLKEVRECRVSGDAWMEVDSLVSSDIAGKGGGGVGGIMVRVAAGCSFSSTYVLIADVTGCTFSDTMVVTINTPNIQDSSFRGCHVSLGRLGSMSGTSFINCTGNSAMIMWSDGGTIRDCTFVGNRIDSKIGTRGGVFYCVPSKNDTTFEFLGCTFRDNEHTYSYGGAEQNSGGGAIACEGDHDGTVLRVKNCTFSNNRSSASGDHIWFTSIYAGRTYSGCRFEKDNTSIENPGVTSTSIFGQAATIWGWNSLMISGPTLVGF